MKKVSTLFLGVCLLAGTATAQQEHSPMIVHGQSFIGTPYTARTLEVNEKEELIINRKEVDCTTFVEYVLALSLCTQQSDKMQEEDFPHHLQRIRYRKGKIDGYTSRLHYIADWINNGVEGGFLQDLSAANSPFTQRLSLSYMSAHPEQYKHLNHSPANVSRMKAIEEALSRREVHWTPKEQIPTNGLSWVKSGDIIAITTNIPGLDVAHMGLAIYVNNTLHLLHASYKKGEVWIDPQPLSTLLESRKSWTGIRVLRCFPHGEVPMRMAR